MQQEERAGRGSVAVARRRARNPSAELKYAVATTNQIDTVSNYSCYLYKLYYMSTRRRRTKSCLFPPFLKKKKFSFIFLFYPAAQLLSNVCSRESISFSAWTLEGGVHYFIDVVGFH